MTTNGYSHLERFGGFVGSWTQADRDAFDARKAFFVTADAPRSLPIPTFSRRPCTNCRRDLNGWWVVDQHNLACAKDGERSYALAPVVTRRSARWMAVCA